jgi:hypothetical protein
MKREDKIKEIVDRMISPQIKKSRDDIKLKFKDKHPHENIHDYQTIKWLKSRYSQSLLKKSVNTLLPNNGLRVGGICKVKTKENLANEFISQSSFYQSPENKIKNFDIQPKYFYSDLIMTKIKKLLDIFLEFDGDGSRRLEIGEIKTMFKTNNIPVIEEDLIKLFFKNQKIKNTSEPYLDFFQFMSFALSKESDQDFRLFMRMIKTKKIRESFMNLGENKENLFLPMNFNLVLDYFNNKGKQRESEEKIKTVIDKMDEIINPIRDDNCDKIEEEINENENLSEKTKSIISYKMEYQKEEEDKIKEEKYDGIDLFNVFEEFSKLFKQKHASERNINFNELDKQSLIENKKAENIIFNNQSSKSIFNSAKNISTDTSPLLTMTNSSKSPDKRANKEIKMQISKYITKKFEAEEIGKIPKKYDEKFKSLKFKTEEKKNVNDINLFCPTNTTITNFKSTAEQSGFNFDKKKNRYSNKNMNMNAKNITNFKEKTVNLTCRELSHEERSSYLKLKNLSEAGSSSLASKNSVINDKVISARLVLSNVNNHLSLPDIRKNNETNNIDHIPINFMKQLKQGGELMLSVNNSASNLNKMKTNFQAHGNNLHGNLNRNTFKYY